MEHQDRTAIVTGAGSGIGRAVSRRLAALGHRVALVGRTQRTLNETAEALPAGRTLIFTADLSRETEATRVIDAVGDAWGRLDVLVNNAGQAELRSLEETDAELLERMFRVNALGPALLIARAWPHFRRQEGGCVVNVTTIGTVDPFPGLAAYAASKCALDSLTRSIMNEGAAWGMRAFSVAPGAVETGMLRGLFSKADLPEAQTLDPDAVAEVVEECVTGRRDAQVGQTIPVRSG